MTHHKTLLAAAVGTALLSIGAAAQAQAISVSAYGQMNRALMHADDGQQKKTFHVDNEISGSRLGFRGDATFASGWKAGGRFEWDMQSNDSSSISMLTPSGNTGMFAERWAEVWVESASLGRLSMGQGDGAANGVVEVDLSGTGVANGAGVADLGGSLTFRAPALVAGGVAQTGATITATMNQMDFESRYDRVQYTTPSFNGFRATVSGGTVGAAAAPGSPNVAAGSVAEGSVWYAGKLGGLGELAAAIGMSSRGGQAVGVRKQETVGGSVSWLHGSGINVTFGMTNRDLPNAGTVADPNREAEFQYVKVGYKWGQHAIAGDYATSKDQNMVGAANGALAGSKGKMMGVAYVWAPAAWVDLYIAYKIHELDSTSVAGVSQAWDDITIMTTGVRVKF